MTLELSSGVLAGLAAVLLGWGGITAWLAVNRLRRGKLGQAKEKAEQYMVEARQSAEALRKTSTLEARNEWHRERGPLEKELESKKGTLRELEDLLAKRERQLNRKVDVLETKEHVLHKAEEEFERREEKIAGEEARVAATLQQQQQRLEELAGMSQTQARAMLVKGQEDRARQLAARKVRGIKDQAVANANRLAKDIIVQSMQRFAADLAVESTISVVHLPSDDMKGRIIGRDGRNIRSFEMITGIEIIVDDTPGIVMLSGFDPLRREVAKNTMDKLILDGRIHPGRIEEIYEKSSQDIEELIRESGSKAAFDLGIHDLAEPLLELLGKLRFRTSLGQNLLTHSKEVGFLAGMMAAELGLDMTLARRAGLLHDIALAIDHDGGDPPQMSAVLARKNGEHAEVVEVLATHRREMPSRTATAALVAIANEISTSRPGAQREKIEEYIQRLKRIEEMAEGMPGVRRAFSLQNGKEIQILVDSGSVDDAYADQMADEIAEKLERDQDQPGQMKVCVIREVRAVQFAN
ncbi:MAG: ribonuclease Y [Candidatus Latescibacteria bacterium]|nr:ribonuclease Y [Candidatus Latescibacterota bacterium]